jgi:hypothetical protein
MRARKPSAFAIANAAAWTLYGCFNLFLGAKYVGWYSGFVVISVLLAVFLWLVSSGLRVLALRRGWFDRDAVQLAWRMLAGVLVGATVVQVAVGLVIGPAIHLGWVSMPPKGADYSIGGALIYWINTAIMLGLWAAAWIGWRSLRRARQSELARLRAESTQRTLELDALRARLNPHFVFNALNNVRALINEDPERARELVTRLSGTLRDALDHNRHEWVTLADELEVVDNYLAIESVHYEDRLHVVRDIDAAVLSANIPPMLLQLLVENAIKHGISRVPGGGLVRLHARVEAGDLVVEVRSPGRIEPGMDRAGVGLAYLRARLARCDHPGRFELRQVDRDVLAQLRIPQ